MIKRGWWSIEIKGDFEPDDCDLEHIARMVELGYTSGDLSHGSEDDEDE